MKIAVISDLHLGRGDASDRFGHDDAEFLLFLRWLEGAFDRIVLLGDIFETLAGPCPLRQRAELDAARAAHAEIARRFDRPRYTYVHGNHDHVAASALGAPAETMIRADGMSLLFTHGHAHDAVLRRRRWISELGVWLGGWLLRLGLHPIFDAFERLDARLAGTSLRSSECSFQRWAVDLAVRREVDAVVTGHTHMGTVSPHGDRLFLNSGHCVGGNTSFLHIDTRTGACGLARGW